MLGNVRGGRGLPVVPGAGQPWLHFKWTAGGGKIELTRDFAAKTDAGDEPLALASRILVTKTADALALDILTQGEAVDDATLKGDGAGLTERTRLTRQADGTIAPSTTADRYGTAPAAGNFEGDSYLEARLVPQATDGAKARFDAAFVGYSKALPVLCKAGFDETVPDLWQPDRAGPGFCLGRPLGGKRFATLAEFQQTAAALAPIGIVPKADLAPVAFDPAVNCGAL